MLYVSNIDLWLSLWDFIRDIFKDVIVGSISFGVSFLTMKIISARKQIETDRLLKMNKSDTFLSLPIRYGRINDPDATDLTWNYITLDEALVISEVQKMIDSESRTRLTILDPTIETQFFNRNPQDNLICIGGPMANDEVAEYFKAGNKLNCIKFKWNNLQDVNRIKQFSDFIYLANEESDPKYGEIKLGNSGHFKYIIGSEGFVMFARLVGNRAKKQNDFFDPEHGTVHILFGVNAQCTLAAVRAFNLQKKALLKLMKKHKGHYLLIVKCRIKDGSVELDFNQTYDFTDDVFDA